MKQKKEFPVSREKMEHLLGKYSREHHVPPERILKIMSEFIEGFEFLNKYKEAVSFYGSARLGFNSQIYQQASLLSFKLAKDGFAIITGGGSGIMEAANKGAYEAGGVSVGINIVLSHEQDINKYVIESKEFEHFFVRKVMLAFASDIYIFFPGGFSTLNELFEMIGLVQTVKIRKIPIILVGREYWSPLLSWIEEYLFKQNKAIDKEDLEIYYLVDNADEAYELIQKLIKEKKVL